MLFNVLLVEDDEADYEITQALLADAFQSNCQLDWVESTDKAMFALHKQQYDLCIVDYQLGPDSGLDFAKQLISSTNYEMPVILLTGQGDREIDLRAMEVGVTDYLIKQEVTASQLERSVRYAIKQKKLESQLKSLAHYDTLTGLANRLLFFDSLNKVILDSKRSNQNFALLSIDLDRFKQVNDTLGHPAGDKLLVEIARRIQSCIRDTDTAARLGGDEFSVLLCHGDFGPGAAIVAEKIIKVINKPFIVDERELYPNTSVGIAVFPKDGEQASQLVKRADLALYSAKKKGLGQYQFYDRGLDRFIQHQNDTYKEISQSIGNGSFYLCYQPILEVNGNHPVAVEALLRWDRKGLGIGLPKHFIPVAEYSNTIIQLGKFVIDSACQQLNSWREDGFKELIMTVNISALELLNDDIVVNIKKALKRYHLKPEDLCLEISESDLLKVDNESFNAVAALTDLGVSICIDSFGRNYGSMSLLIKHSITKIKIDKQLLANAAHDEKARDYYNAFTNFAKSMEIDVIAIGVESELHVKMLKQMPVAEYQGFFIADPMSSDDFLELYNCKK